MIEFKGAVAVVTGTAFRIGRATALALAAEGAGVVVDVADDMGKSIEEAGGAAPPWWSRLVDRPVDAGIPR